MTYFFCAVFFQFFQFCLLNSNFLQDKRKPNLVTGRQRKHFDIRSTTTYICQSEKRNILFQTFLKVLQCFGEKAVFRVLIHNPNLILGSIKLTASFHNKIIKRDLFPNLIKNYKGCSVQREKSCCSIPIVFRK